VTNNSPKLPYPYIGLRNRPTGAVEVGTIVFSILLTCAALAADSTTPVRQRNFSPNAVASGAKLFRSHCAECHGPNGRGGRGPDLTRGSFRHGSSSQALFNTISNGVPGTEMPVSYFPPNQIWQLVAFVKSLSRPDSSSSVPGNPESGARLFRQNGCATCHFTGKGGGRLGPDLTDIGSIRSAAYLRAAITNPNANAKDTYRAVRVVDNTGRQIAGVRLNEDTYSIQIMDYQENLLSFWKRDLRELEVSKDSPMPSFSSLPHSDLDDLTAYLVSLKKKASK